MIRSGYACASTTFDGISDGKTHDVKVLNELWLEPGAIYMMDRGYFDFGRLYTFTQHLAFFVIRAKRNLDASRQASRPVDKTTGLRSDQTIHLNEPHTSQQYPASLRRLSRTRRASSRTLPAADNGR